MPGPRTMPIRASLVYGALVVAYAGFLFAHQLPGLLDPHVYCDDSVNWVATTLLAEPDSTAADERFFARVGAGSTVRGWNALLTVLDWLGDPGQLVKFLPWLLLVVALPHLFGVGERLGGPVAGFVACILLLHAPFLRLVGTPAAFAFPLLIAFLYHLQRGHERRLLGLLVLQGLFYAPILINSLALYAISLVQRDANSGALVWPWRDPRLHRLAVAVAVLGLVLFPWNLLSGSGGSPRFVSFEEDFAYVGEADGDTAERGERFEGHFDEELRVVASLNLAEDVAVALGQPIAVVGQPPWRGSYGLSWILRYAMGLAVMALVLALFVAGRRAIAPPSLLVSLTVSAVLCHLLSLLVAFYLYYPERYVHFALTLVSILYLGTLAGRLSRRAGAALGRWAPLAALVLYLFGYGDGVREEMGPVTDRSEAAALIAHLEDLDASAVLAGPTQLMDAARLLSRKDSTLYCQEEAHAHQFAGSAGADLDVRADDLYTALYAVDGLAVAAYMEDYGVDYLVTDRRIYRGEHLDRDDLGPCSPRTVEVVESLLEDGGPWFLEAPPASIVTFSQGPHTVISRDALDRFLSRGP